MTEFDDVVIHIGYHKTGSTLLQDRLFVGSQGCWSPWPQAFYHQHLLLDRPDRGWASRVRAAFAPGIEDARTRALVPVLTCEALSGDIWRSGQSNGYANFHVADLLAAALPGARIAVVHREQVSMLVSLYKHSLRANWAYSVSAFLDQQPLEAGMPPVVNFGYLEYSWLLEHYMKLVGREKVLALPFEMVRDNAVWAAHWGAFLGLPVHAGLFALRENPGYSTSTVRVKRLLNFALPATALPMESRAGKIVNNVSYHVDAHTPPSIRRATDRRLHDQVRRAVGSRFAEDNGRLQALMEEDWSPFGY